MLNASEEIRQWVIKGEFRFSDDQRVVLSTTLGSCVATCIHDPIRGVGGMNHFHLPGFVGQNDRNEAKCYGAHLMEVLIKGLLDLGADRDRLEAKLFGGATIVPGLSDVGDSNSNFARQFLEKNGVRITGSRLGGIHPMRVEFWPVSGRARQLLLKRLPEKEASHNALVDTPSETFCVAKSSISSTQDGHEYDIRRPRS